MKLVVRLLVFLFLASCGGFLPFFGDDDDDVPPPKIEAARAGEAEVRDVVIDGIFVIESGITQCVSAGTSCMQGTQCCGDSECRSSKCCILSESTPNVSLCCTGMVESCVLGGGALAMCCLSDK